MTTVTYKDYQEMIGGGWTVFQVVGLFRGCVPMKEPCFREAVCFEATWRSRIRFGGTQCRLEDSRQGRIRFLR